ncbi:hypothetical protein GCM10011385_39930 [Nitratireductor aestuarii]|uniref:Uncharacterized protein n=1 Tax=Nitratireductor aestuarii TaxID=1735103 RepID=A0A916S331_9HYPH|nr:hypothetical protein GCM10011385_39930 [Nitratireductor aestuarii]
MGTQLEKGIHWQGDGIKRRRVGDRLGKPELMRDAIHAPESMPAIVRPPQIETIEVGEREARRLCAGRLRRWRRRQHDGLGLKARNPELGLPVGERFRIAGEIATPSVVRMHRAGGL